MRQRLLLLLALLLLLVTPGRAQRAAYFGSAAITNAAVVALSAFTWSGGNGVTDQATTSVLCLIQTANVNWRADPGNPTNATDGTGGMLAPAGSSLSIGGPHANLANLKFIATTSTNAGITCQVFRP